MLDNDDVFKYLRSAAEKISNDLYLCYEKNPVKHNSATLWSLEIMNNETISTYVELTVFSLEDLKLQDIYRVCSQEKYLELGMVKNEIEALYHPWQMLHWNQGMIIFNEAVDQGYIFYSLTHGVDIKAFLKNMERTQFYKRVDNLQYFREILFIKELAELPAPYSGMIISQFRALPGMTEEKLAVFVKRYWKIDCPLRHHVSLEDMLLLEPNKLKNLLELSAGLPEIFRIVTKNHLLGIDNVLPEMIDYPPKKNFHTRFAKGEGRSQDQYPAETWEDIELTEQSKLVLARKIKDKKPEILLHHWWVMEEQKDEKNITEYYSPDIPKWLRHSRSIGVLKSHLTGLANSSQYFQEKEFIVFMEEHDFSLEEARKMSEFTQSKLEILFEARDNLPYLFNLGLNLKDFGSVEEKRLRYLLHPKNRAGIGFAYSLVNIFEIFGLPKREPQPKTSARPLLMDYVSSSIERGKSAVASKCFVM